MNDNKKNQIVCTLLSTLVDAEYACRKMRIILRDILQSRRITLSTTLERQIDLFSVLYVAAFQSFATNAHLDSLSSVDMGELLSAFVPKELGECLVR